MVTKKKRKVFLSEIKTHERMKDHDVLQGLSRRYKGRNQRLDKEVPFNQEKITLNHNLWFQTHYLYEQ